MTPPEVRCDLCGAPIDDARTPFGLGEMTPGSGLRNRASGWRAADICRTCLDELAAWLANGDSSEPSGGANYD